MTRSKIRIGACLFILIFGIVEMVLNIKKSVSVNGVVSPGVFSSALMIIGGIIFTITALVIYRKEKIAIYKNDQEKSLDNND
jgi:predicted transporter